MNQISAAQHLENLEFDLDAPLPEEIFLGQGVILPLSGWCYCPNDPVSRLDILIDDVPTPLPNHSWGRTDVFMRRCPRIDKAGDSLLSGFTGYLTFPEADRERNSTLKLRAMLRSGRIVERLLGSVRVCPGLAPIETKVSWPGSGPRVAICMATFNSPLDLFRAQVSSLQAQTHTNWVCIISDDNTDNEQYDRVRTVIKSDKRFIIFQNRARLSFYRNFEHVLRLAPADADYIALCDQDDVWHADKLQSLILAFGAQTVLAYSDARVLGTGGRLRSETFWSERRNNYTDLGTLMVANTITGAASMIRPALLPHILPFPKLIGPAFHDHWIGLVALLHGKIDYVDRPLYDYIQHFDGVIGHNYNRWPGAFDALLQIARAGPRPRRMANTLSLVLKQAVEDYTFVIQKIILARTLLLRNPTLAGRDRQTLERFSRFETSMRAAIAEKFAAMRARRSTLNLEGMFVWAMAGTWLRNLALRFKQRDLVRIQIRDHASNTALESLNKLLDPPAAPQDEFNQSLAAPRGKNVAALEYGATKWIVLNIVPFTLDIDAAYPKRINVILATINFDYVFGGYIGMFNLALRLRRDGYRVRVILHERTDWNMHDWRIKIQKYPGITTLFDEVEVISRFDRTIPVEVNPADRFIATSCWSAHIAHHTARQLAEARFLFMAQEYEPYFMPMNSISALFQQAYDLPQVTLFSTPLLREFFEREKIGVFAEPDGKIRTAVFSNAIQKFHPAPADMIRPRRRVLFYARPEEHAARNMFELGMMAIAAVAREGRIDLTQWSFFGIGSISGSYTLELAPGVPLELVPKTSLQDYVKLLPRFDVGLSLMMTPHPSLVPIEMASAGLLTVTNTFANKTAARLREISTNLIGVAPTVEAIRDGLLAAMARADDVTARLAGARVNWPTDWAEAFPADSIARVHAFLGAP